MARLIDLHMHTNCSDGVLAPAELLARVRQKDIAAFAVTDHDSLAGYRVLQELVQPGDPELISGVELSVDCEGEDLHMLGYLCDPDHPELNQRLAFFQQERNRRGLLMVEKLNQLGVELSFETVQQVAGDSAIGRPHVAEALLRKGLVENFDDVFRRYIGNGRPAYVKKARLTPGETIDLIHTAGGVAVMAHPGINGMYRFVDKLAPLGLDGVEVYHYAHDQEQVRQFKRLAKRYGLLLSGGSDFHGRDERECEIGAQPVPLEYLDQLKNRAQETRGQA